ncbi:MAG: hypothetical protein LQ349_007099 [Xanthoria aureola]|nr:MAG: hypothetical protein LQ349_007099 [Xanthoria aureola]
MDRGETNGHGLSRGSEPDDEERRRVFDQGVETSEDGRTRSESRAASAVEDRVYDHSGSKGAAAEPAEQHQYASVNPLASGPAPAIPVQQPPIADTAGDQGLATENPFGPGPGQR